MIAKFIAAVLGSGVSTAEKLVALLLMESGDALLQENGDKILLE